MTPEQINIECAKLDGWVLSLDFHIDKSHWAGCAKHPQLAKEMRPVTFRYTTSYDAIIPLIQKQDRATLVRLVLSIKKAQNDVARMVDWLKLTPLELATALLKAKGII